MKKWKRVIAVAAAASFAVTATPIQALAYTQDEATESETQGDSQNITESDEDSVVETEAEASVSDSTSETETGAEVSEKDNQKDSAILSEDEDLISAESADEADMDDVGEEEVQEDEEEIAEYKDGVYQGTARGHKSDVTVEVTVKDGKIISIEVLEQNETKRFWSKAVAVIDSILDKQSTDVDAISGATHSSTAIKEATKNALASEPIEAEAEEEEITSLSGQGTKDDPYVISTEKELIFFRDSVNDGDSYQGEYISQTADIELTADWTPIGTGKNAPFSGSYDGNNYTISNLTVSSDSVATDGTSYYAGLFGYSTTYADFSDIRLSNVVIDVTDKSGIVYAGTIVGSMYNTVTNGSEISVVDNCYVSGSINVGTNSKSTMTGGLVGMSSQYSAITNNTVKVSVNASTDDFMAYVGGIVGMASINSAIVNNAAIGDVTIQSNHAIATAGGIVGQAGTCLIYNNYAKADVCATKSGGVIGNALNNTWLLADYYITDKAYGACTGNVDTDTVLKKTADEMSTEAFAELMHSNLSAKAKKNAAEKVDAAGKIDFDSFLGRVDNYYDWELVGGDAVISSSLFAETEDDLSIFDSGDGSEENPYMIATEEQLRAFATSLSDDNTYKDTFIALANDIKLTDGDWTVIGQGDYAFSGNFDGKGHTVSNLTIGSADNHYKDNGSLYYGFFGALDADSFVKDLTLDVSIYVEGDENLYVAGLSGYVAGTVDSVTVNGTIWGRSGLTEESANHFGGGLAGYIYRASILNCVNNASVYAQAAGGVAEAGGIAGLNNRSLVANCVGNGKISGSADRTAEGMASLGGIIGVHAGTMVSCVANADIESADYSMYVGELAGWATGIAYLYDNFYNSEVSQVIEGREINPIEAVGWLVGPGTNDENESFAGGVNSGAIAVKASDIKSDDFAKQLNDLFNAYPVQITDFTTKVALRKWNVGKTSVIPNGETTSYTYVEPVIEEEEEESAVVEGVFYGRSSDASTILKLYYDENGKLVVEVLSGDADENSTAYKEAYAAALTKMQNNDHTAYGKVDPSIFESGSGTADDPYVIATEQQLVDFNMAINTDENFSDVYILLGADINLSNEWSLAGGNTPYPFSGVFDGQGHTISGLRIGSEESPASYKYAGLFPYLLGAIVKDVRFTDAKIYTSTNDDSRYYAGVLAAATEAEGTDGYIDSVYVSDAYVSVATNSGAAYAAGLVGYDMDNVIANCKVEATVSASSKSAWNYAGVLTGLTAWSAIINNRVSGSVSVSANLNKAAAGGIAGMMAAATYSNAADVTISSERYTNDLGEISGRSTGISYGSNDYYNADALIYCGGEAVETKAVGTVVDGAVTTESFGLSSDDFNSNVLLEKLNSADEADAYNDVLSFLIDSWDLDFAAKTGIKDWALYGLDDENEQPSEDTQNQDDEQMGLSEDDIAKAEFEQAVQDLYEYVKPYLPQIYEYLKPYLPQIYEQVKPYIPQIQEYFCNMNAEKWAYIKSVAYKIYAWWMTN